MQDIKNIDMIDLMQTRNQAQLLYIDDTLRRLRAARPNDRSSEDRCYAIVITDIERARAYFKTYVLDVGTGDNA
jgi:hypothetical protein